MTCSTSRRATSSCPGTGTVYVDAKLSVIRRRAVGQGFTEELTILNHADKPVRMEVRIDAGERLRRPVRGQGRAEEEGHVLGDGEPRHARARLRARDLQARDEDLRVDSGESGRARAHPHRAHPGRTALVDRAPGRGRDAVRRCRSARDASALAPTSTAGSTSAPTPRVRLGLAAADVPPQPRRPRRAPLLSADRRRPQPAGGRPALVHDDVRPRQHPHEPAGAPVRAGARRDDAAARSASGRASTSTTSATRIPAGSSTRCATAR